jgi:acetylornithine/N-succinyldiaminopimelate aminotransferase
MNENIINAEHELFFQTYKRLPLVVDRAEGVRIYCKDGSEYLDFLGGIAVNALGHSHQGVISAIEKQIKRYMHVSNYFYQDTQIEFASKLKLISGYDKVFLCNSGTEATDGAIKLVRKWGSDKNKNQIIAFSGGFHGRTYGALSIMDKPLYKESMGPYLDNMSIIPYNDISALEEAVSSNTAAIWLEFIQGEGGISCVTSAFVDAIKVLQNKYGFLVVADEIQSGTGRTGKFFAFNHYGIIPDIVTLAKGIGGGLPLGCILGKEIVANVWNKGNHGTTFGGNSVSCATGIVVLDELSKGLMDHVTTVGTYFVDKLSQIMNKYPDKVLEVKGLGLMLGLVISFDAIILVECLLKHHVIANAASGNVLRLVPPLIITNLDVDEFIHALDLSLSEIS